LGKHQIRYAIMPHKGDWQSANIPLAADFFNAAIRPVQTNSHEGSLSGKQASVFAVDNHTLRFSTIKQSEERESFIVRLYNPTSEIQNGNLRFATELKTAWYTNLNEQRDSELQIKDKNIVSITTEPHKIITIEVQIRD